MLVLVPSTNTREKLISLFLQSRSTPHLTSVQAEHLLARACENEAENAKRMRMGLEPISQPMPAPFTTTAPVDVLAAAAAAAQAAAAAHGADGGAITSVVSSAPAVSAISSSSLSVFPSVSLTMGGAGGVAVAEKQLKSEYKSEQLASLLAAAQQQQQQPTAKVVTATAVPSSSIAAFANLNGNGAAIATGATTATAIPIAAGTAASLYRSPAAAANSFQVNAAAFPGTAALLQQQGQQQQATALPVQNGPAAAGLDGLKKPPLLNHKLNATEIGAVRQLITGYRESAAFLLRSADELEHLLQIQPKL